MRAALVAVALAACDADVAAPRIASSVPAAGATDVDPAALAAIEIRFDQPMDPGGGQAALAVFDADLAVPLQWSADAMTAAIPVRGWLSYGEAVRVTLTDVADAAGDPLAAVIEFRTRPGDEAVRPRVIASSPAPGATDVYPAQVHGGTAARVRLAFDFDEPMDPHRATITWAPAGGAATGTWNPSGTQLVVDIVGSALTGQRPLADATAYEIDLRALRDRAGNRLDPASGLLRFTTGTYDPLLNHSCGHVFFGPYGTAAASATPTALTARTDAAHTRYTVTLPASGSAFEGFTRLRPPATATWHLFLDGDVPIQVESAAGVAQPVQIEPTPVACAGITHRATFAVTAADEWFLYLGPQPAAAVRFIVEVTDASD